MNTQRKLYFFKARYHFNEITKRFNPFEAFLIRDGDCSVTGSKVLD